MHEQLGAFISTWISNQYIALMNMFLVRRLFLTKVLERLKSYISASVLQKHIETCCLYGTVRLPWGCWTCGCSCRPTAEESERTVRRTAAATTWSSWVVCLFIFKRKLTRSLEQEQHLSRALSPKSNSNGTSGARFDPTRTRTRTRWSLDGTKRERERDRHRGRQRERGGGSRSARSSAGAVQRSRAAAEVIYPPISLFSFSSNCIPPFFFSSRRDKFTSAHVT